MKSDLVTLKEAIARFGITNNQARYVMSAREGRPLPVGKKQNGRQYEYLYLEGDIESALKEAYPKQFDTNLFDMTDLAVESGVSPATVHRKVKTLWMDRVIVKDRGWYFNEDSFEFIVGELTNYQKNKMPGRDENGRFLKKGERQEIKAKTPRFTSILNQHNAQDNYMIQAFLRGAIRA